MRRPPVVSRITDVKWEGQKIVVMDQVVVVPPYKTENCSLKEGCPQQALQHVKKLVSALVVSQLAGVHGVVNIFIKTSDFPQ